MIFTQQTEIRTFTVLCILVLRVLASIDEPDQSEERNTTVKTIPSAPIVVSDNVFESTTESLINTTVSYINSTLSPINTTESPIDTTTALTINTTLQVDLPVINNVKPPDLLSEKYNRYGISSCSHMKKLSEQPLRSASSKIRKCCPHGETLVMGEKDYCETYTKPFEPSVVTVELYEHCIEDLEETIVLPIEVGNPCNSSFVYSFSRGDRINVMQNGWLLVMDVFKNKTYDFTPNYCLDTDVNNSEIFALFCVDSYDDHIGLSQTILYTCFMLVSIPCLCAVTFIHLAIKELRSVHGMSLALMSACLAIGFFLHTIAQISEFYKTPIGYLVQFFMLSYFMWLFSLCSNVVLHVWYYLPLRIMISRCTRYTMFIGYAFVSFSVPLILVLITKYKGLPGMPSYFFQAQTEWVRESQRYFIQPVSYILALSAFMLVLSFFGFRRLQTIIHQDTVYQQLSVYTQTTVPLPLVDQEGLQEIKKDANCISCLFSIIVFTWILELVTFYKHYISYTPLMDVINALQGVFILMIFITIRRRRNTVIRWWHDRGSHEVTQVELNRLRPSTEIENGTDINRKPV